MERLDQLPTPALLLDLEVLERNVARMARRAQRLGVALRPHVKTHKCLEIAELQERHGAAGFTVSTLDEARVFVDRGFTDLTWAFPLPLSRLAEARRLAQRANLRLLVDSPQAVAALEAQEHPFHVWLKVDCGYHRAGVDPSSGMALELARRIATAPRLVFDGILTHSGQAYDAPSVEALRAVAEEERRVMVDCAERLRAAGIAVPRVSVGSTPATSVAESLDGVDEARPGNYVFYDHVQVALGACTAADCALTVLASVVSRQRDHAVVDAGALALSKDPGTGTTMGEIYRDYAGGILDPELRLVALSQEHGHLNRPLAVGERLRILPNHSCLTAACFDHYTVVRGDEVVGRWRIWRQRT
ncbi:MAG: hypothetical protein D6696_07400 [Acidobacteria bacterium]|nr:MAG: hypothetical protein D6696_07400 [Acidobacteriota bacterium]